MADLALLVGVAHKAGGAVVFEHFGDMLHHPVFRGMVCRYFAPGVFVAPAAAVLCRFPIMALHAGLHRRKVLGVR